MTTWSKSDEWEWWYDDGSMATMTVWTDENIEIQDIEGGEE